MLVTNSTNSTTLDSPTLSHISDILVKLLDDIYGDLMMVLL